MADSPARLNTEQKAKSGYSLVCEEKEDASSNVTVRRSRTYLQNDVEFVADVQTTIMQMLEKMNATLTKVNETCTATQQSLQFTQSEVANLRISNENLKTENKVLKERIIKCECKERDLERRVAELTYFCATLDNADRKSNLLIEGAPEGQLNYLHREHRETTIIGDFNMEFINQGPTRNKLVTLQNTLNLKQLINERTRLTSISQSTIDLIFTNCMYVSEQGTLNTNFSDHLPVYYIKKKTRNNNKKTEVFGRSYTNYDQLLPEMNWEDFNTIQDPEELRKIMNRNIELVLDRLGPVQKLVIPESKPKWLTRDIILLMRDRDYFFARARRNNRADDWNISRFLRNRVNQAIKNHKATKIKRNLERHKSNPKKFWDSIRDILPGVKDNTLNELVYVKLEQLLKNNTCRDT